jgi:hypothetical protein
MAAPFRPTFRLTILALFNIFVAGHGNAQDGALLARNREVSAPPFVVVHASVNASSDFYSASGIAARQPGNISRLVVRPTITLFDQIQLPFELFLSTQEMGFQQPFNQFGVNPRFGDWLTLHAGYFSTRYSEFSFGDLRVLGGGIDLSPGQFRLSFMYGISSKGRGPDSALQFHGEYRRTMWACMVGYGGEESFNVHLNVVHAADDSSSIISDSATLSPAENLALSLSFGIPVGSVVRLTGEVGVSGYSSDVRVEHLKEGEVVPSWLFVPRGSTQADAAGRVGLVLSPFQNFNLRFDGRWIGPGFVTLGYSQISNDVLDATVAPDIRLLNNALYARASLGVRWNNLRGNRISTTRRVIGSFSGGWSVDQHFGVDMQYSNYGMKSSHVGDTLRIDNIYQLWSVAPRYMFEGWGGAHSLMMNYTFQDLSDNNPKTADLTRNSTHVLSVVHSMMFPSTWSVSTSGFFTYLGTSAQISRNVNFGETVGRSFLENNRLTTALTLGYGMASSGDNVDGQVIVRATANYGLGNYGGMSFSISNNSFNYANPTDTRPNFRELQASILYSFNI